MSLAQVLSTYVTANVLIGVGYLALSRASRIANRFGRETGAGSELRLHYAVLAAIFGLTLIHPLMPRREFFQPAAKVWSAQSIKSFSKDYTTPDQGGYLALSTTYGRSVLEADRVSLVLSLIAFALIILGASRLIRDLLGLRMICRSSYTVKKTYSVALLANDRILVPFSFWLPGRSVVVMPTSLMAKPGDYRMAVAHELQHHRQRDTKWVYAIWMMRVLFVLNPFAHIWGRLISEIQEFACDEALVDRKKVESRQYTRCLIEVAETVLHQRHHPVSATGLMFLVERNLLKRRIERMITPTKTRIGRSVHLTVGALIVALMAITAFASQGAVQDRRVSLEEAQKMASRVKAEAGFPIVVNDLVLTQLNRYIGTPEGREYMHKSLQRMENYRPLVEGKLKSYQVPTELAAMPLIESGYQNLEQGSNSQWGAGIWMFIKPTAKKFGLRVDDKVDQRLDATLLTDAAMRLLKSDSLLFNDWTLSVLAFNIGENRVQTAIRETGSRDPWKIVRAGYSNDPDYLPRLMAAILIMRNPETVQ